MSFPVYFQVGGLRVHPHLVMETLAYAVGFRVYLWLRKRQGDEIEEGGRLWIIACAALGAMAGSKMLYWLEDPGMTWAHRWDWGFLMGGKTIVGALIGGLIAVEVAKWRMGITARTGDLFAVPLCVGMAIGRVGCFLTGLDDHTAGTATTLPWGVNFGDGVMRHPTQLYEVGFLLVLGVVLWRKGVRPHVAGDIFKIFMVAYFAFRLACDFIKRDVRVLLGLSSIQWACVAMLIYYGRDMWRWVLGGGRGVESGRSSIGLSEQPSERRGNATA